MCSITPAFQPYTKFLFIGPIVCRRLPSDSTSRWTPLPLAVTFPLSGRFGDLHPLEYVRAGRTRKKPQRSFDLRGFQKTAANYSPTWCGSTIIAGELNFSVRNGKRWFLTAITTALYNLREYFKETSNRSLQLAYLSSRESLSGN